MDLPIFGATRHGTFESAHAVHSSQCQKDGAHMKIESFSLRISFPDDRHCRPGQAWRRLVSPRPNFAMLRHLVADLTPLNSRPQAGMNCLFGSKPIQPIRSRRIAQKPVRDAGRAKKYKRHCCQSGDGPKTSKRNVCGFPSSPPDGDPRNTSKATADW